MPRETTMDTNKKEGSLTLIYPMLIKSNYTPWAIKMKVFMQAQGVWDVVEPMDDKVDIEVRMDKMAMAAIYQGISEDIILSLAKKKSAKEAWSALKTMFMGADRVKTAKIQTLKVEFEALNMKESEGIDDFVMKLNNMDSDIRALGDKVDESYVVKKLLRVVPNKFLQIASTIEQFGDLEKMSVKKTIGRLKAHKERIRGPGDTTRNQLLLMHEEWIARSRKGGRSESSFN